MNTKAYSDSTEASDLNDVGCFEQQQGLVTTCSDPAHVLYRGGEW